MKSRAPYLKLLFLPLLLTTAPTFAYGKPKNELVFDGVRFHYTAKEWNYVRPKVMASGAVGIFEKRKKHDQLAFLSHESKNAGPGELASICKKFIELTQTKLLKQSNQHCQIENKATHTRTTYFVVTQNLKEKNIKHVFSLVSRSLDEQSENQLLSQLGAQ